MSRLTPSVPAPLALSAVAALALFVLLLGGCAGRGRAAAAHNAVFAGAEVRTFRNRLEDPPPWRTYMQLERSPEQAGAWRERRSVGPAVDGPWTPQTIQLLRREGDAHIVLVEEINFDEQVELVYDPPLVLALINAQPGDSAFQQTTYLRVHPLGNRDATKAAGAAAQQITIETAALADAPAARSPTLKRTLRFTAALAPAEVTNSTTQWIDGTGALVAETRVERTRVFSLPSRNNRESWVIVPSSP